MKVHRHYYLLGALAILLIVGPLFFGTKEGRYTDISLQEQLSLEEVGIIEPGSQATVKQVRTLVRTSRVAKTNEGKHYYSFSVSCRLQDGSPLSGVAVSMRLGNGDPYYFVSNEKGIAQLSGIRAGRYTISAEHDGYSPIKSPFHRTRYVVIPGVNAETVWAEPYQYAIRVKNADVSYMRVNLRFRGFSRLPTFDRLWHSSSKLLGELLDIEKQRFAGLIFVKDVTVERPLVELFLYTKTKGVFSAKAPIVPRSKFVAPTIVDVATMKPFALLSSLVIKARDMDGAKLSFGHVKLASRDRSKPRLTLRVPLNQPFPVPPGVYSCTVPRNLPAGRLLETALRESVGRYLIVKDGVNPQIVNLGIPYLFQKIKLKFDVDVSADSYRWICKPVGDTFDERLALLPVESADLYLPLNSERYEVVVYAWLDGQRHIKRLYLRPQYTVGVQRITIGARFHQNKGG